MVTAHAGPDFRDWRKTARELLHRHVLPNEVTWIDSADGDQALLAFEENSVCETPVGESRAYVSPEFLKLAGTCVLHRDPARWDVLYRVLWRLTHGETHLLKITSDVDVHRLYAYEKAVRRDCHKMTAFVRFKEIPTESSIHFIAWYQPDHYIVKRIAPFFAERFNTLRWSILTPDLCVHFLADKLSFTPGETKPAPLEDSMESLWLTYYASIFNPARLKTDAMKKELPVRFWENLPEAQLIPDLIQSATERTRTMIIEQPETVPTASAFLPKSFSLPALREAAEGCMGCELYKSATQTVFGEGAKSASLFFIGEQPGDQEDLAGKPFVGPAGQLLDKAFLEAGIDRDDVYITNAVKHFRFEPRGKRRIHSKPSARHVHACKPWLDAEVAVVKPKFIVCLGATAAQALLGPAFKITTERGKIHATPYNIDCLATYHPSALLRVPDRDRYAAMWGDLVSDLKLAFKQ